MIFIEHDIQQMWNINFFKFTHGTFTKREMVLSHNASHNNFIALKSYKGYPLITTEFDLKINKIIYLGKFHIEVNQYISKSFVSERRNRREILKYFVGQASRLEIQGKSWFCSLLSLKSASRAASWKFSQGSLQAEFLLWATSAFAMKAFS